MAKLPHMISVTSYNIKAIGYDDDNFELHVQFKNGGHYVHRSVGKDAFKVFLLAPSPGRWYAEHVRGKYAFYQHKNDEEAA